MAAQGVISPCAAYNRVRFRQETLCKKRGKWGNVNMSRITPISPSYIGILKLINPPRQSCAEALFFCPLRLGRRQLQVLRGKAIAAFVYYVKNLRTV